MRNQKIKFEDFEPTLIQSTKTISKTERNQIRKIVLVNLLTLSLEEGEALRLQTPTQKRVYLKRNKTENSVRNLVREFVLNGKYIKLTLPKLRWNKDTATLLQTAITTALLEVHTPVLLRELKLLHKKRLDTKSRQGNPNADLTYEI
jgi:hypothetical protein